MKVQIRALINFFMGHPVRAVATATFIIFWVLVWFVPLAILGEVVNGINFAVSIAIAVAYGPYAFNALLKKSLDEADQFLIGLTIVFSASAVIRVMSTAGRFFDMPTQVTTNPIIASLIMFMAFGGALLLAAPAEKTTHPTFGNWRLILIAVFLGGILGGILAGVTLTEVFPGIPKALRD